MNERRPVSIAIIDYQMSNLFSVQNVFRHLGYEAVITSDNKVITRADAAVLPGVGAFADAMAYLKKLDLISPLREFVSSGRLFMGICLGMQLLFTESEEFGDTRGLDILRGRVIKFDTTCSKGKKRKVPHMGWNQVFRADHDSGAWEKSPMGAVAEGEYMYFVHSYYVVPQEYDDVLSLTRYEGVEFCSSVTHGNIFATQFHPEKSAVEGVKIYQRFALAIDSRRQNGETEN